MPEPAGRSPGAAVSVALVVTLVVLVVLSAGASLLWADLSEASFDAFVEERARGRIAALEESMALTATLGAATGERAWSARYERLAAQLTDELGPGAAARPGVDEALASILEALPPRMALERRALDLGLEGQDSEARAMLDGAAYAQADRNLEERLARLADAVDAHRGDVDRRARNLLVLLAASGIGGALVVGVAWVLALRGLQRWGTEAEVARRTAVLGEARRELLLESVEIGSFEAELAEGAAAVSPTAARLLGVEPGLSVPFQTLFSRLETGQRERFIQVLRSPDALDGRLHARLRVADERDGTLRHVEVVGRALRHPDGSPWRVVGVLTDVTSQAVLDDARSAWTAALERRVAARSAEAEARTRQARQLAAELTRVEQRERRRLAMQLHDGLQQLLVAARLRVGATGGDPELDRLLGDAVAASRDLAVELDPPLDPEQGLGVFLQWVGQRALAEHGLHVDLRGEALDDALPQLHAVLFARAARELLFNVVKHAGVREAELRVSLRDGERVLDVLDRGSGMDADAGGTGTGLVSLARRFEALGGGLRARERVGGGTAVQVWLPSQALLDAPSVLLVDDNADVRAGLARVLARSEGIRVVGEASGAEEALRLARELHPDVVVIDVSMPGMNGVDATAALRAAGVGRVIALSSDVNPAVVRRLAEAGAAAVLDKGTDLAELPELVRTPSTP